MRRFSYRLDSVLKRRANEEEKAIIAQSAAQEEYTVRLGELEKLRTNLKNACETEYRELNTHEIMTRWVYMDYLKTSAWLKPAGTSLFCKITRTGSMKAI
ncbi:MAG: hypothetical protein M1543_01125 [Firmicutes bacterium]|nr:hypothetical protein [Bacillota bacterium]